MGFYGDFHIARIDRLNQGRSLRDPRTEELARELYFGTIPNGADDRPPINHMVGSDEICGQLYPAIVCPCPRISVHFDPSVSA